MEGQHLKSRCAIVALLVVAGLGLWQGANILLSYFSSGLTISLQSLDLGDVWAQPDLKRSITICNSTSDEFEIEGFSVSCQCSEVNPKQLKVPAKGSAQLNMTINASPANITEPLTVSHPFAIDLIARVTRPIIATYSWTVTYNVRHSIKFSAAMLEFDEMMHSVSPGHLHEPKSVRYESAVALKGLDVVTDRDDISVVVQQDTDRTGILRIAPDRTIAVGPYEGLVRVVPLPRSGGVLPEALLKIRGVSASDIRITPSILAFGTVDIGEKRTESILLSSRTGCVFSVSSYGADDKSLKVTPFQNAPNGMSAFQVEQSSVAAGPQTSRIVFHVRTAEALQIDVPLAVNYVGVQR